MSDFVHEFEDYLKLSWKTRSDSVMQAQTQLLNWLFAVHGAGIAGSLGFLTSKGIHIPVAVALGAFVFGLLALLVYGTLFYYFEERRFGTFKADVAAVECGAVTIGHFIAAQERNSSKYRSCEIISWLTGISGLVGLGALIVAVLRA